MILTDLGSYVTQNGVSVLPWPVLLRAGVEGAIFKGAQEDLSRGVSTTRSIKQAWDGGAKSVGCFYWDDPTVLLQLLLDSYSRAIELEKPEFISVDIEQHSDWSGNPLDPNFLNDHAQGLTEGLASRFPELLMLPYSAKYMTQYIPKMVNWIDKFENWTAAWPDSPQQRYRLSLKEIARGDVRSTLYDGSGLPIRYPDGTYAYKVININDYWQAQTANKDCLIRQYSSRILLPWEEVGNTIYDHQYDWDFIPMTIDEWKKKIKKDNGGPIEITMAGTYKTNVLTKDRGHFVWLSSDDKNIDMVAVSAGSDAVFLRMCSQVTGNMTVAKDTAFPIWTDRATKPVAGVIELDENLFWNKEITLPIFQSRTMWTNETLRAILDQWHIAQIPQAEWDNKKLNISAKEGWHNIGALVLFMSTTTAKGSPISGMWQQAIVDDLLKPLTTLMEGGYIPTVKIYLMASWDWYKTYATDAGWTPAARIANKQLAGLGLTRVWGQETNGLMTEVPMGTPYTSITEFWQNVPSDSYVYPLSLEGIDFQFFVFSFNRLLATGAFYAGAVATPITCGMWCDTAANMGLGANVVVPPVEPPVIPPSTDLEVRVKALEDRLDKIDAYLKSIPKY